MKKVIIGLFSIFTVLFFISCGSKPAPQEQELEPPVVEEQEVENEEQETPEIEETEQEDLSSLIEKIDEARKAAVDAVRQLSIDVGIPQTLVGTVKEEDIPELAKSAYEDACRPGNPREVSVEEIEALYRSLMK